jgi:hypothetical protein
MKTTLLAFTLFAAGLAPAFVQSSMAVVTSPTLDVWTFETSVPTTAGSFTPEIGTGSASGYHASTSSVYSSPAGNGSAHSFSSNYWSVGDYYQFQVGTIGLTGLNVSFDQTSSNTGPKDFELQYSTNGTSFTNIAGYSALANGSPNTAWSSTGSANTAFNFSYDLSSISALLGQSTVYFRLIDLDTISANGSTVGTGGTDRVDNFTVTAIPEPSTYALLASVAAFAIVLRRRKAGTMAA